MNNENFVADINFEEARRCAQELTVIIQKMNSALNELEDKVNNMKWSGGNATNFKNSISKIREELNTIYTSYISKIPEAIDMAILNYQNNEQ